MNITFSSKTLYFFVFILLINTSLSASENINEVDDNGLRQGMWVIKGNMTTALGYDSNAKVEEGSYLDNRKEGLWKKYWPQGVLKSEITYALGKPNGQYSVYYKNGQLEETGNWVKSKNTGDFRRFYENGNPQQEFTFADNGKRNGVQKYYHPNGKLELEANILNGKEEGDMKRYYADGKLKEKKTMQGGVLNAGSIKTYTDHQEKEYAIQPKKEAKKSTKAIDKPNVRAFDPEGYNTLYNTDLQKTQVGEFKNGRLWDGRWYRYTDDGLLDKIEIYKLGRYAGITDEKTE